MLTGKQVRVRFVRDSVIPLWLDSADAGWLGVAEDMLALFRQAVGQSRGSLDEELEARFADLPDPAIFQGLAKLLEDRCDFETQAPIEPPLAREAAFLAAASQRQTLVQQVGGAFDRAAALAEAAQALACDPLVLEQSLLADLKGEQTLTRFDDLTPERLLQRYNVGLAQAVLLRSTGLEILLKGQSPQRLRQLFRAIKFHRLICEAQSLKPGVVRLALDGPLSLFSATQKYGLQLALLLPTLLLCDDFEMTAKLRWGPARKDKVFRLGPEQGLITHQAEAGAYVPAEIAMFVELFRQKISDWELAEAPDVVRLGTGFWVPDFSLIHRATGQTVLLDILGFWRRSNLEKRLAELREHASGLYLLAISEQLRVDDDTLGDFPNQVVRFRNMPLPEEIARRATALLPGSAAQP